MQPDKNPILEYGDIIVVNNVALHGFDEGQALAEWLNSFGATHISSSIFLRAHPHLVS